MVKTSRPHILIGFVYIVLSLALLVSAHGQTEDTAGACIPASERAGRAFGCFIMAAQPVGQLGPAATFWHVETYTTRLAAEKAKTPRGVVLEAFGKVWLLTIAEAGWRSAGATDVAEIGPLPVASGTAYTAQFMEAVFRPGMKSRVHRHGGPEAWYTLSGETCLETPEGTMVGRAGGGYVIVPQGPPMELTATGSETRRALVLILHDSAQPHTSPAPDWTPKGLCTGRPSAESRADHEAFLLNGRIVTDVPPDGGPSRRASLDDGLRKHDAAVATADGSGPTRGDHRFNVAAYELDKLLGLELVPPSVQRLVGGRAASLTWWVDGFAMNELDRRRKAIDPPDYDAWGRQVDAVRVFDELISNTYRDPSPGLYLNTVWDNLLITKDWTVWITDHTAAFRTRLRLEDPASLMRCPRTVFARLRELNREQFERALGRYLSSQQLDALDVRRALLVKHFSDQIARDGEATVLYDLRPRQ